MAVAYVSLFRWQVADGHENQCPTLEARLLTVCNSILAFMQEYMQWSKRREIGAETKGDWNRLRDELQHKAALDRICSSLWARQLLTQTKWYYLCYAWWSARFRCERAVLYSARPTRQNAQLVKAWLESGKKTGVRN